MNTYSLFNQYYFSNMHNNFYILQVGWLVFLYKVGWGTTEYHTNLHVPYLLSNEYNKVLNIF